MTNRRGAKRNLGLVTIMALALVATTRDATAGERKGLTIGLGMGGGQITCDSCEFLSAAVVAGGFHFGGMVTERLAIVLDASFVSKEGDGLEVTSVVGGPAIQYWLWPRVWVKGGVGSGQVWTDGDGFFVTSENGLGLIGGIGVEVLQKQKFTIDLQFQSTTARIAGERISNIFGAVGFNFYWGHD